ncbi:MAG: ABC transporter family substrate-binding protein [Acidimicrobiales bacterium]
MRSSCHRGVAAVALAAISLTAAGSTAALGGQPASGEQPAPGGTVVVAGDQLLGTFNPYSFELASAWTYWVMQLVWPQASNFQPDGTVEWNLELLADEPTLEVDPQRVTYRINDAAEWSDGTPITADDFVFTWEASNGALGPEVDPETGENLPLYDSGSTAGYEDQTCAAADELTVVCEYTTPYADWPNLFGPVLPRHAFAAAGGGDTVAGFNDGFVYGLTDPAAIPSGNWFSVAEVNGEETLRLVRNEQYWGEPALLDEIVIRWITDPTQLPAALENGEVDVIFPSAQIDTVEQTRSIAGTTTIVDFGTFYEHLDFNVDNVHLATREVRQAIGLALDRQQIVDRLVGPVSPDAEVMNHHFFYPGGAAYEPNGAARYGERDVEAARALLESAGYIEGAGGVYEHPADGRLSLRITWREPNPRREQTAQLVQASLAEAGIAVETAPAPDFAFLGEGNFDIALFGYTNFTVPSIYTNIYGTDGEGNVGRYSNPEVDTLFAEADQELDSAVRAGLLDRIDEILWEDLPVIPLFQVPEVLAFDSAVLNVEHNGYQGFTTNANEWAVSG